MKRIWLVLALCMASLLWGGSAFAVVSGACSNCHTMHNSQDGAVVVAGGAQAHLTKGGCLGCHTGVGVESAPTVDRDYNVDSLAGGTFDPTGAGSDSMIHNVDIVGALNGLGSEGTLASIPGASVGMNGGKGSTDPTDLTCAGSNGCHGDADVAGNDAGIQGFHHGTIGSTGYRLLQIASTGADVVGTGASDYEEAISDGYTAGDEHNVYSSSTTVGINKFCANCHPDFYGTGNTKSGSDWVKHPTDNTIPGTWTPTVNYRDNPFAFADISGKTTTAVYDATDAQVACLSCHRAHGSDYADLLRWDYTAQVAGSGLTYGCLGCHNNQR